MQLAGFTDYLPNGTPYMGLVAIDGAVQAQIILGDRNTARHNVNELIIQLKQLLKDVEEMPDKLIAVRGDIDAIGLLKP